MVKRSALFRFPLGTFDELGLHSPKGACIGHKAQGQPEMESLKGDMPSCDSIKLDHHCTRNKFAAVYTPTHTYTQTHTQTYTRNTLSTTGDCKETSLSLNLARVKGNKKYQLRTHDQATPHMVLQLNFIVSRWFEHLKPVYSFG